MKNLMRERERDRERREREFMQNMKRTQTN